MLIFFTIYCKKFHPLTKGYQGSYNVATMDHHKLNHKEIDNMLGAIIGDIVGSIYEFRNIKTKDFDFMPKQTFFTDDSVMTIAIGKALLESNEDYSDLEKRVVKDMVSIGIMYPGSGYGRMFYHWLFRDQTPYGSYGNGAPMRVSACGIVGQTLEEVKELSHIVTGVSHNHPESYKAAEATAVSVFLARQGMDKVELMQYVQKHYYPLDFTCDGIRETYKFDPTAQGTTPQALQAFFESTDFENAIRIAISIGGDSDTLAAITGAVAEAYYGIPHKWAQLAKQKLTPQLKRILHDFHQQYPTCITDKQDPIQNLL